MLGVPLERAAQLTWHSGRATLDDWAWQRQVPPELRKYLGAWQDEQGPSAYLRTQESVVVRVQADLLTAVAGGWRPSSSTPPPNPPTHMSTADGRAPAASDDDGYDADIAAAEAPAATIVEESGDPV